MDKAVTKDNAILVQCNNKEQCNNLQYQRTIQFSYDNSVDNSVRKNNAILLEYNQPGGAAKAQWIHLLLLSCRPGFKSQPQLLH